MSEPFADPPYPLAADCHLCGNAMTVAPDGQAFGCVHVNTESRTGPLLTVACSECSLVQTLPHPTAEEVREYYASGQYRREFPDLPRYELDENLEPTGRTIAPSDPGYELTCDRHGQHAARRLADMLGLTAGDLVLEVGGGDGRVNAAMRRAGIDALMLERDPRKAKQAEDLGARVVDTPGHGFEVVFALQVAEHFADPVGELAAMVALARPGGTVFLEVPTVERPYVSLTHFLQKPHVVNYSRDTLAAALHRAGLDDVHTAIDGSVLLGWGVRGTSGPRPYEPHGGPPALEVVGKLHAWERQRVAAETAERRINDLLDPAWREAVCNDEWGQPIDARATLDFIADEFVRWRKMGADAGVSLAKLCTMLQDYERPDWHADPWVRGFYAGRIYEGQRMGTAIAHINNGLGYNLNRKDAREA